MTRARMKAMILRRPGAPLSAEEVDTPDPGPGEVLLRVEACGVCRTDLHIADGELARPRLPLIPGHEIVGRVEAAGPGTDLSPGDRVGVPWLGGVCGECGECRQGRENLCERAEFTGYTRNGGYAEFAVARAGFCFPLPSRLAAPEAAPLLCAGLIGYRAWVHAGPAQRLGLYGFGAAAHILAQVARAQGREVYGFVRPGDAEARQFALDRGCVWAGWSDQPPPVPLDAAIIFAPVGALVPAALAAVRPAGTVVCAGIHMSDLPSFPYRLLWEERVLRSVANLTRADGREFFALLERLPITTQPQVYPLGRANQALDDLRAGRVQGAAVLVP